MCKMTQMTQKSTVSSEDDFEEYSKPLKVPTGVQIDTILKSVFLIILGITGNFTDKLLGCKLQNLMSTSMYARHIMLLSIIFFTLDFSKNNNIHPIQTLLSSFVVWFFVILVNKMTLPFIITSAALLGIMYVINVFINYYKVENEPVYKDRIQYLYYIDITSRFVLGIVTFIGFIHYYLKQRSDYVDSFDLMTFIFGSVNCNDN